MVSGSGPPSNLLLISHTGVLRWDTQAARQLEDVYKACLYLSSGSIESD